MEEVRSLVERAEAALARIDRERASELGAAWRKSPWTVGLVGGDASARAALIDLLCGDKVVDPFDRKPGGAAVRVRRGPRACFRAIRDDASVEEHALASAADDPVELEARIDAARGQVADRELAIERVENSIPASARRKPAWWQLWRWPIFWIASWLARRRFVDLRFAEAGATDARRALEQAREDAKAAELRVRQGRARYVESLRTLIAAPNVREVVIEVADGPLPAATEVVELVGATRAASDVDAVVVAERETIAARAADGTSIAIGSHADASAALAELAAHARAVKLVRRASGVIAAAARRDDAELSRHESAFQTRFAKLDALEIADPDAFVQSQRLRLRPQIVASVHAVMEHASVHLGQELATMSKEWIEVIKSTKDTDELKLTVERIEASSPQVTQRIVDEVRLLVGNGVAGVAHDLVPELEGALRAFGLPAQPRAKGFAVAAVEILPTLGGKQSKLTGGWLAGLFRSFDAKRNAVREKAHEWLEHAKELANAELLDVEPKLHAAVADAVAAELARLVTVQQEWLATTRSEERDQIMVERAKLAPLAERHERARRDLDELARELERIERERPAVAAAAAAAIAA